jgi:hypothetical protein
LTFWNVSTVAAVELKLSEYTMTTWRVAAGRVFNRDARLSTALGCTGAEVRAFVGLGATLRLCDGLGDAEGEELSDGTATDGESAALVLSTVDGGPAGAAVGRQTTATPTRASTTTAAPAAMAAVAFRRAFTL